MLLEKLKQKYPDCLESRTQTQLPEKYLWIEYSGEYLGILRQDLSAQEISLIEALFSDETLDNKSEWGNFLLRNNASLPLTSWKHVRFIHFRITQAAFSRSDFEEAFLAVSPLEAIIIWENSETGVLIEGLNNENADKAELTPIVRTLESDLYVHIHFYLGYFHEVNNELRHHYQMEKTCFTAAVTHFPDTAVSDLPMVIPYIFLDGRLADKIDWYTDELLGEMKDNDEVIHTVKTYIETSSNASLTAKKLYIHRNSLQYRIDRFIEKTGLDIRTFHHALPAYLLLMKLGK